ncbi:uncharacterized protein LOC110033330 [Phalaenopsis equestris]|uniref:uncharacterized protein LOC110033330 n=1 Tax=Phalaenopsis equestris TaxID=78828 RepID=UPI0009E1A90F|nr:uncharacterized protein LOC110033330 [Phalaenopsis equestris]
MTLVYLPRINETPLTVNGANIPANKEALIELCRVRSINITHESDVVFASSDQVCIGNGIRFEVWIDGKKALQGIFRRGAKWEMGCDEVNLPKWAEISVVTKQGLLMRELMKLKRKRFHSSLLVINEEDEIEPETKKNEMGGFDGSDQVKEKRKEDGDGTARINISWALNVGVWDKFSSSMPSFILFAFASFFYLCFFDFIGCSTYVFSASSDTVLELSSACAYSGSSNAIVSWLPS